MRKFVIGGNWKLQINTISQTKEVLQGIVKFNQELNQTTELNPVEIFLAVPYTALAAAKEVLGGSVVKLAAQNVHYDTKGPYTGEISIESLQELQVNYVLIGHSERRIIFHEQDHHLNLKIHQALDYGIKPVFCIGETAAERNSGKVKEVLYHQLASGLEGVSQEQMEQITIAYEPVWAINNALLNPDAEIKAATPEEALETHKLIRDWLVSTYDQQIADDTRILYGGSMKPANAEELLALPDIDGGLIGGASLSVNTLGPIIRIARELQTT
jgi:triosephosphate isomerase